MDRDDYEEEGGIRKYINDTHGTIVECTTSEEATAVYEYMGLYNRQVSEVTCYIGSNTNGGLYWLSNNKHSLAGETISFEEFLLLDNYNPNELYRELGMEEIHEA